ncbi:hypothetical protein SK128_008536, partial [Halocaridina rubra]
VLKAASRHVDKTLYIHLDPQAKSNLLDKQHLSICSHIITSIYSQSPSHCNDIDVRVLMAGFKNSSEIPLRTNYNIDLVMFDRTNYGSELSDLEMRYKSFTMNDKRKEIFLFERELANTETADALLSVQNENANNVYCHVVLGGTFDRIHNGHKILLSEALLRCKNRLTVGVADGPLLKNKTLKELVEPCERRLQNVRELLQDIDPTVEYNVVQILDPMGPARWDAKLELIVASAETKKGVTLINDTRKEDGLNVLNSHVIDLVNNECRASAEEEEKISSSSMRMRLLGSLIKPIEPNTSIPDSPYIIGLTGGSASGKSSVSNRFAKLGASVIDCDKLGHEAYLKGTECYSSLIKVFGSDIVNPDGEINRKALGLKVFNNKDALEKLNSIVWPEIARLANEQIKAISARGVKIVILDAAVLLEAKWELICHQIWVCVIKRDEAIRRIVERDGKTKEEAERRISYQLSNEDRVAKAHMVFCTQWSGEYTQQQCEKAWKTTMTVIAEKDSDWKAQL